VKKGNRVDKAGNDTRSVCGGVDGNSSQIRPVSMALSAQLSAPVSAFVRVRLHLPMYPESLCDSIGRMTSHLGWLHTVQVNVRSALTRQLS
jgi:hypothetical protein